MVKLGGLALSSAFHSHLTLTSCRPDFVPWPLDHVKSRNIGMLYCWPWPGLIQQRLALEKMPWLKLLGRNSIREVLDRRCGLYHRMVYAVS